MSELLNPGVVAAESVTATPPARLRRRRLSPASLLGYAAMAVVLLVYLYPLLFLLNTALKSDAEFLRNPAGVVEAIQLQNFATAWEQGRFGTYFLNSVVYTFVAAGLGTLCSLMAAFPVARGYVRFPKFWNAVFVAMMFLPNTLVMLFQMALRMNLYDTAWGYVLILASGVGVGPLLITGYLKSVPREIDEAAAMDGASYARYLFAFIPRLLQPVLSTVFILQAIGVWNDIILATILLPSQSKWPLTLGLFAFRGTYTSQWSLLAAATLIVAMPLIVVYLFLQRYIVASVVGGAVKG